MKRRFNRTEYIDEYAKKEISFLKGVRKWGRFELVKNNRDDKYEIDFVLLEWKEGEVKDRGFMDLEIRENDLGFFDTIHIPKMAGESREERKKVEIWRRYPRESFHLSWDLGSDQGYLIRGDLIIESREVEVYDKKTGRVIYCFDVEKERFIMLEKWNLVESMVRWLR